MITHAKRYLMRTSVSVGLMVLGGMLSPAFAQEAKHELPLVTAGAVPLYPRTALLVRIQGVVKIRVTTDGKKVASVEAESGPPMLVKAAKENILTWEFAEHKSTSFVKTFEYRIEEPAHCDFSNGAAVLHMPLEIRVSANGVQTCDPATEIKPHP